MKRLWDRLNRIAERRRGEAELPATDDTPLTPEGDAPEARLIEAVRKQLRREGVPAGTPVDMARCRQALLASPEACEAAHALYEQQCGAAKVQYGLRELSQRSEPGDSCNPEKTPSTDT